MNEKDQNRILTVPNILSFFRLCLVPVFVWLYSVEQNFAWAAAILILSGLTDLVDGIIARRFHSVSNLGKILDPIADKLTQAAALFCLILRFPLMIAPFILLVVKEIFVGITGAMVIRRTGKVYGANWHGKVATWLLYITMIVHVIWHDIPLTYSNLFIVICIIVMAVSFVLYGTHNIRILRNAKLSDNAENDI